jgi:hypothetical protein
VLTVYRTSLDFSNVFATREEGSDTYAVHDAEGKALKFWTQLDGAEQMPDGLPNVVAHRFVRTWVKCDFGIGEYYSRIWRGDESPRTPLHELAWASSYGAVSTLVRRMSEVFHYIEPNDNNAHSYGHETRQLLIIAATEVESSLRAVLLANNYLAFSDRSAERLNTRDYVKLMAPMRLMEWTVRLTIHPAFGSITPFATWDEANPTTSLPWYDAYNAVKHDRENSFSRATLRNAVEAVAAAYVLVLAQFGEFDNRQFLGLDEFRQISKPRFLPTERYVPPAEGGRWTPTFLFRA